jgi:uncharacterized protein (DUF2236 family)
VALGIANEIKLEQMVAKFGAVFHVAQRKLRNGLRRPPFNDDCWMRRRLTGRDSH